MAKKWYHFLVTNDSAEIETAPDAAPAADPGPPPSSRPRAAAPSAAPRRTARTVAEMTAQIPEDTKFSTPMGQAASFEEIYAAAEIHPPANGYSILKVAEMLQSEHIRSLPPDVKRKSVLVALDAAGVPVQLIVEDAVRRDRALDAFERVQQKALEEMEANLSGENARAQQEIEKLIAEKQARIKANNDALAKEVATVQAWRTKKLAEEARIAEAVGYFVAENPVTAPPAARPAPGK